MQFRVAATALNLRAKPSAQADRVAVLPQGCIVARLALAEGNWWRVGAVLQGAGVEGFVNSTFLVASDAPAEAPPATRIGAVHLKENRTDITRHRDGGRAFPIGEADRPPPVAGDAAARRAGLLAIIDWLDVESGERWLANGTTTFCNIYAHDVCHLAGVYLPRVWWTPKALMRLGSGEPVAAAYGETVRELSANDLADWFEDYGPSFGWRRLFDLDALQASANQGRPAIIVAQRTDLDRSGHIQLVAPEHAAHAAHRADGKVIRPLQSQAGVTNFRYGFLGSGSWWSGSEFRKHGFWAQE
ncbi:SH3 domain-containing protein [Desertibaculum subflavum]|uniref:SH3 domain-containing protein n=1 Tax=Desertibaculum subflavum TaxID=2268458 RepID=UPI000E667FF0